MKHKLILSLLLAAALLLTACAAANTPGFDASEMEVPHAQETGTAASPETTAVVPDTEEKAPETTESVPSTEAVTELDETVSVTEEPAPEEGLRENSAFTGRFSDSPETVIGFLYNDPFSEGAPVPTEIWNEGEFDKLVIVPRYVGSVVSAFRVTCEEEDRMVMEETPSFSSVAVDGTEIAASLDRPEGMAAWYIYIELPDGAGAGMLLEYNGRYGTPVFEFLEEPYLSGLIEVPTAMEDWNPQFEMIGYERFWAFWRAAQRSGVDTWEACKKYASALSEVGDGAAFTLVSGGDMDGDTYRFQTARFHTAYFSDGATLAEETAAQYELYQSVGNAYGILGPDREAEGEELVFRLTGLTVFNPSLCAKQVQVTVNGVDAGVFDLDDDFCTLLPLELPDFIADSPINVEVKVVATRYGTPETAVIEVFPGLGGNISNAV